MSDLTAILARIEQRLKKLGTTATAASKAAGKPDSIRNLKRAIENRSREGISSATIKALAPVLETTEAWILTGEGIEDPGEAIPDGEVGDGQPIRAVNVIGVTQAGTWVEFENFEDEAAIEAIPAVPGKWSHLKQFAYKVRGNSMDADRIFDGDYVIAVKYFDARKDLQNDDRVIVERTRNSAIERSVKIVSISGTNINFLPKSTDPKFKPFSVPKNWRNKELDDTTVSVVGLVIGRWSPM